MSNRGGEGPIGTPMQVSGCVEGGKRDWKFRPMRDWTVYVREHRSRGHWSWRPPEKQQQQQNTEAAAKKQRWQLKRERHIDAILAWLTQKHEKPEQLARVKAALEEAEPAVVKNRYVELQRERRRIAKLANVLGMSVQAILEPLARKKHEQEKTNEKEEESTAQKDQR